MTHMARVLISAALLSSGCAAGSTGPTPVAAPLLLSGQSNAVFVGPFLAAAYPGTVAVSASSGSPISAWDWTDPGSSGQNWRDLEPQLRPGLRALVWWQGESDAANPHYAADLTRLLAHIREVAQSPTLPIVLVQVEDVPEFRTVRVIQGAYVANDPYAVLVSTDGAPLRPGQVHLTDDGYRLMADRIIRAIP